MSELAIGHLSKLRGWKMAKQYKVGDKVTVRTCSGDYPAVVKKLTHWSFTEERAYQ